MARNNPTAQVHRASLLRSANLVKPALAAAEYVPAYTHIRFANGRMLAHDDIMAIEIKRDGADDVNRCIPGGLLIRALNSFSSESVGFGFDEKTHVLTVSSGRSKVKLPTLAAAEFPFDMPTSEGDVITLTKELLTGIERCLPAAGNDAKKPDQMGVTLEPDSRGYASVYSTDSTTISRYATKSIIGQAGDPSIILPIAFCEQLLALVKAYPDQKNEPVLVLMDGAISAEIGTDGDPVARLFHKTLVDVEPLEFSKVVRRFCDVTKINGDALPIPDSMDAAFGRALLVQENAQAKTTHVELAYTEVSLHSSTDYGDSDEVIDFGKTAKLSDLKFKIDPALVTRALKWCKNIAFYSKVIVLSDGDKFLHIIAHV